MTIYNLVVVLSQFWTSQLFHVQFWLLFVDPFAGFSGDRKRWLGIPTLFVQLFKGFIIINEAEVDVFWNSLAFYLIKWMLATFSKLSFHIWKFLVHILLKSSLKDFEHYLASVWNECNCVVVWTFFGIAFLWDWNENWPFPILWPLLRFPNLLAHWVQDFHSIIF